MKTIEYGNEEVTVIWNKEICKHAAECVRGLPKVFKPKERRWIQVENGTRDEIIEVVNRCPTGAISIKKDS